MTAENRQRIKQAIDQQRRAIVFTSDTRGRQIIRACYRDLDGTVRSGVTHGTHWAYQQGCRCPLCRDAETNRTRLRRKEKAA